MRWCNEGRGTAVVKRRGGGCYQYGVGGCGGNDGGVNKGSTGYRWERRNEG